MNAVVKMEQPQQLQVSNALSFQSMDQIMRLAEMMSKASLVPAHLQQKPADCLLVCEQAARWGMSPFAVAQATSVIQGKLMYEGKLVSAVLNSSGALNGRISFEVAKDGSSCTASAVLRGESQPKTVTVKIAEVKTANAMWTKQPEQQLCYSAARVWARRHCPEVMLGVYTPEEFDVSPAPTATTAVEAPPTEKPPYPDANLDKNHDVWFAAIQNGKKTPDEIIAMVESRYTLTEAQRKTIRGLAPEVQA